MSQYLLYHFLAMGLVYQCKGEAPLSVLDFSADGDLEPDTNGEYTYASVLLENFPSSFTLCTAFMVEHWKEAMNSPLFLLLDDQNNTWLYAELLLVTGGRQTFITIQLVDTTMGVTFNSPFFPMQWSRICFSYNSKTSEANLVFNGKQSLEWEKPGWDIEDQPANVYLILGQADGIESPGQITDLNIVTNPSLNLEEMTKSGSVSCGAPGDFLSWKDAKWTLHSKAKIVQLNSSMGPCRRESAVYVYPMEDEHYQKDCMQLCEKLRGRSPSVRTYEDWEVFVEELRFLGALSIEYLWLSATEGDQGLKLYSPDHWPKGTEAMEGVWRDYYTGEELANFTKPWSDDFQDMLYGEGDNCIQYDRDTNQSSSWTEWQCVDEIIGCPCTYDTPPVLTLRGYCSYTDVDVTYAPIWLTNDKARITMIGLVSSHIEYIETHSQWILKDKSSDVTATTNASQSSFALGKHNWTIRGDSVACSKEPSYTIEMKLSACSKDEFTCDDGQCIRIEQRCNQLLNCRDESDEKGCNILLLRNGYNKQVPPLTVVDKVQDLILPVNIDVSIELLGVVSIKEEDHAIEFQFEIDLEWRENRATYHNLNKDKYLNTLSMDDMNKIWLPLVVYTNTIQRQTTRLGGNWEWTTNVWVKRKGNFTISDHDTLDEIAIFQGEENTLVMMQSYTHEFQ